MKDLARKPKRRTRVQTITLDPELTALASVLAEHEFDEGVKGWLIPNWRDGWNAIGFALEVSYVASDRPPGWSWLYDMLHTRSASPESYWIAEDMMVLLRGNHPTLTAAYRCFQIRMALNSAGDGSIYNTILSRALLNTVSPREVSAMLEARCRDAIGTTAVLQNDHNDKLRSAFKTAWSRRLYGAAYALPQAK